MLAVEELKKAEAKKIVVCLVKFVIKSVFYIYFAYLLPDAYFE